MIKIEENKLINVKFKKGYISEFGTDCFGIVLLFLQNSLKNKNNAVLKLNLEIIESEYLKFSSITNLKIYRDKILFLVGLIADKTNENESDFLFISEAKMPIHFALMIKDGFILETNQIIGKSFLSPLSDILKFNPLFFKFKNDLFTKRISIYD